MEEQGHPAIESDGNGTSIFPYSYLGYMGQGTAYLCSRGHALRPLACWCVYVCVCVCVCVCVSSLIEWWPRQHSSMVSNATTRQCQQHARWGWPDRGTRRPGRGLSLCGADGIARGWLAVPDLDRPFGRCSLSRRIPVFSCSILIPWSILDGKR